VSDEHVDVLIGGGSLVGLSTALFLGRHGVRSLVVEHNPGSAIYPRAALFNQRTVEIYRNVGLEAEVTEAAERVFVQNGAIMSVETLGGNEIEWYSRNVNEGVESLSPSPRLFATQVVLEPVLREGAEQLGARVEYNTDLASFEQDDDGVTAVVRARDGGAERTIRARYLIAADGSRSPARERLGIPMTGHGVFSNSLTIYFRADVRELVGDRNLSVVYLFNDKVQGFFRFEKTLDSGFFAVSTARDTDGNRTSNVAEDMSVERCIELVRDGLGPRDIPVEIENVQRWRASADAAESFTAGRVFLAGDAAHTMPPTGGFGGNTGVQDGYDLAWKLAYVLKGHAGEGLLSTYDSERRPVGKFTVEQAYTRYVVRLAPELGKENLLPYVPEATVELGYRYDSPAILYGDAAERPICENPLEPSASPGARAPHLWVQREGATVSTVDLTGTELVLLAGPDGGAWIEAARSAAAALAVPLAGYRVAADGDLVDADEAFPGLFGTGREGAVLLRPDGFVAWRATAADLDAVAVLDSVLRTVLVRL
jgi:2-polyprenyl-6-methoxyphenol hydroxylase-like FAD-dependent oxidoreductase